jgi:hypothetical protein
MKTGYIYAIFCGDSIYVGRTRRLKERIGREHGNPPFWAVMETITGSQGLRHAERKWMEYFESFGVVLLNKTKASSGVDIVSEDTRRLMSIQRKGRRPSRATIQKMKAALRGVPKNWTPEVRAKIERTQFKPGVSVSPATQFKPGHRRSQRTRFKKGQTPWNLARQWPEETKQKMRGRRKPLIHGTRYAYSDYGCRCDLCRENYSELNKRWWKTRRRKAV